MPDEIIGAIPNSINVPLLLAIIIRSQYKGSDVSEDTIPYSGIWLITRKTRSVKPVHTSRLLKGTLLSGSWISGTRGTKGLTRSRNRTTQHEMLVMLQEPQFRNLNALQLRATGALTAAHDCGIRGGEKDKRDEGTKRFCSGSAEEMGDRERAGHNELGV